LVVVELKERKLLYTNVIEMSLHLYFGPMFSGKSSKLIQEYGKYKVLGKRILVVNHASDSRYSGGSKVVSHNHFSVDAVKLSTLEDARLENIDVVLIDEGQFFPDLYNFCREAVGLHGLTVVVFSLDGTFDQQSFGQVLQLVPFADSARKLVAYCKECKDGTLAPFTRRTVAGNQTVMVGADECYEAVCRSHLN
jgi:thymidine kinase